MSCRYDVDVAAEIVDLLQMEITPGNQTFSIEYQRDLIFFSIDAYSSGRSS